MRLALRRARGTKGLLLAAAGAALVATVALTGLAAYSRDVVDSGTRSMLAAATAEERSILVRAAAGRTAEALRERDGALRQQVEVDLDGLPARVSAAGYAAGRQLRGDTGDAVADRTGAIYASVMFLDDLPAHARLTAGAWPQAGAAQPQTALAAAAAATLRVQVGDRIPITDGLTERITEVTVVGVFTPVDPDDPYWRLAPETATGSMPQAATYGPMTVHRDDFVTHFLANASAGWLVEPDLSGISTTSTLDQLAEVATRIVTATPAAAGLGDSAVATSSLAELVPRLQPGHPRRPVRIGHPDAAGGGARRVRAAAGRHPAHRAPPRRDRAAAGPGRRPLAVGRPERPGGHPGRPARRRPGPADRRRGARVRPPAARARHGMRCVRTSRPTRWCGWWPGPRPPAARWR